MEAEAQEELNNELLKIENGIPHLKEQRREYLSTLRDVLDVYLISVMEDEDAIYSLLSQRSQQHYILKTISPFQLQFKILMNLPFLQSDIQVEGGEPGFVKLKLPVVEEGMMKSKVWTEACHRGIQNSLIRHINQWKDDSNYLKQTAFLEWLAQTVDKSLALAGTIPNYQIQRQQIRNKVILYLEDKTKNMKFTIELLPVLAFPSTQLPQRIAENSCQDQSCDTWSVQCRSNASFNDQLWGVSLWQHEKLMIREQNNLKSVIHILKTLRDGCGWEILTNYHIRTLVLQAYKRDRMMFEIFSLAELVLQLLLLLRDKLVDRGGLPFLWDGDYNLLCGLTGLQKSELARAVTKRREYLRKLSDNYLSSFRWEIYNTSPIATTPLSQPNTFQSSDGLPEMDTPSRNFTLPATEAGEPSQPHRRVPSTRNQPQPQSRTSVPREPPQIRTLPSSQQPERVSTAEQGGLAQANRNDGNWWQNFATVAAGVATVAVGVGAAFAIAAGKNKNTNKK